MDFASIDIQWWQTLVIILGALGLSPAPWILGLALNRLQFTATARADVAARIADINTAHAAEIDNLKAQHVEVEKGWQRACDELKDSRNIYAEASRAEYARANTATQQLAEVAVAAGRAAATTVAAVTDAALKPKEGGA